MKSRRLQWLIRTSILIGLSMVLVFGFWEHRSFYQYGLPTLLVVGGFVTLLVILAFRFALTGRMPHAKPVTEIALTPSVVEGFHRGTVELLICPAKDCRVPVVGRLVLGRTETGEEVARFKVLDAQRKRVSELTDGEARRAGYGSASELRAGRSREPEALVAVLAIESSRDAR